MHEDDETLAFAVCLTRGDLRKLIDEVGYDLDAVDADTQKKVLDAIARYMVDRHRAAAAAFPRTVPDNYRVPWKEGS
jgi:hypothetical protein